MSQCESEALSRVARRERVCERETSTRACRPPTRRFEECGLRHRPSDANLALRSLVACGPLATTYRTWPASRCRIHPTRQPASLASPDDEARGRVSLAGPAALPWRYGGFVAKCRSRGPDQEPQF